MIPSDLRLYCPEGSLKKKTATWVFIDFDSRKWLKFEGPMEPFGSDEGELAEAALLPVIDHLEADVTKITFEADGKHWEATKDPDDDVTPIVSYPSFTYTDVGHLAECTLERGMWEEIDRIGPGLDLVRTRAAGASTTSPEELFVFKYYLISRPQEERVMWIAPFFHRALSAHEDIVPFGDFVIDKRTQQLVGYTTKYIPGGSLDTRYLPVFKRKWMKQLMSTIDLLNLQYGLLHQDIAPRNLVLYDTEDRLLLFDFDFAALDGSQHVIKLADDVRDLCFTIYEILTGDTKTDTGVDRWTRQLQSIMDPTKPWVLKKHMRLEPGVSVETIRDDLKGWIHERQTASPSVFELQGSLHYPKMIIHRVEEVPPGPYPVQFVRHADPTAKFVRWERPLSSTQHHLRRNPRNEAQKG